jgi:hypothetical protein
MLVKCKVAISSRPVCSAASTTYAVCCSVPITMPLCLGSKQLSPALSPALHGRLASKNFYVRPSSPNIDSVSFYVDGGLLHWAFGVGVLVWGI